MGKISGRFFIVGSARSGTTLLQAMIARHPRVFSFPESHFFCVAAPKRRLHKWFGLADKKKAQSALIELAALLNQPDSEGRIPRHSPFFFSYSRKFVEFLDHSAKEHRKDIWLEKTPHHIDFIPIIDSAVKGAKYIHILRRGRDVLASQYHANSQDPGYWGNWSIERMVEVWNNDVSISLSYKNNPSHLLVSYENLTEAPKSSLERICEFMEIDFQDSMLQYWKAADQVLGFRRTDPWMQSVYDPSIRSRSEKFPVVFSMDQQDYITNHLLSGGDVELNFKYSDITNVT